MTSKINLLFRAIRERPYFLLKYIGRSVGFTINYVICNFQVKFQPNVRIGNNLRTLTVNPFKAEKPNAKISVGDSVIVYNKCDILVTGRGCLSIGSYCSIGSNFRLYCKDNISIGNMVLISWNVLISDYDGHSIVPDYRVEEMQYLHNNFIPSFSHKSKFALPDGFEPQYITAPIIIGNNVWIGANAIILKGVQIGSGSVIGAGAVVTKSVPERCIVAGNPARVVKEL